MPTVTVGQENNADIGIYHEDHGAGQLVVLIHGYPLSGRARDKQQRSMPEVPGDGALAAACAVPGPRRRTRADDPRAPIPGHHGSPLP